MKYITNKTTKEEIQFEIPCYIKFFENKFFKIISTTQIVVVTTYEFSTGIEIGYLDQRNPFGNEGWEFTTEHKFKKAFDTALGRISELEEFSNINNIPV